MFTQLDQIMTTMALMVSRQLYLTGSYSRAGATSMDTDPARGFEFGSSIVIRRPKIRGAAQDLNPRVAPATLNEQEWVEVNLSLNHAWADGFPAFNNDAQYATVVNDSLMAVSTNVGTSFEGMFYSECFRDYSGVAASGAVQYASAPPLQLVFAENASGVLNPFTTEHLARANACLGAANVPAMDRFAFVSSFSAGDWAVAAPTAEGQSGALAGVGNIIQTGLQQGMFIPRAGFNFGVSNSITGQAAVTTLGDGTATEAVSAYTADTTVFFDGDRAGGTVPLGAVRCTIGVTGTLTGLAVGQIARLGPDAGPATAYGVILRVDVGNKYVWLVPYNSKGQKLTAAQLSTSTDKFGVPAIPYVNTAHHREFLVYGTRPLRQPMPGAGGQVISQAIPEYGAATVNIAVGAYNAAGMKQDHLASVLCGCKPSDHRKAAFMLSA